MVLQAQYSGPYLTKCWVSRHDYLVATPDGTASVILTY
uniref:Uncharacterized protein n=1 Tax=Anguilla anguilla TaxID=7936 RepID=A0A0E9VCN5_ANGAN